MPDRRGSGRRVAGILACIALVAAAVVGVRYGVLKARRGAGGSAGAEATAIGATSTLPELGEAARNSDARALAEIHRRLPDMTSASRKSFTQEEAEGWLLVLGGMRTGFLGFNPTGRIAAIALAAHVLDGFAIEPAAAQWSLALPPLHDLLIAALAADDPDLRASALEQIGKLWVWLPGRSITEAEETLLVKWKESLYRPVVRSLGHRDARTLVAAIACLGALPIDNAAAPALAYIDNPETVVRKHTLVPFAARPLLLTDDMLLARMHDEDIMIRETAESVLKASRHLSQGQISLGALIFSPRPQQRVSVIPLLKDRSDVDPAIWLIQLSRDPVEMVRLSAIEAMAPLKSSAVKRRLTEMARSDASEAVRKAAGKLLPQTRENTASLPPLPGSPSLAPRAN